MESFLEIPLPKPTKHPEARPPVHISFAKHTDALTLAEMSLLAFEGDKWGPALHPEQAGLTTAELLSQHGPPVRRRIQRRLVEHHIYTTASIRTKDDAGNETNTVAGWAAWANPARVRRRSFWEWLWAEVIYPLQQFLFRPAISPGLPQQVMETYESQYNETFGPGSGREGRSNWYLHILCVHPCWQGLGIGGALLDWGFERAKETNAAVYVESTISALPVYLSKGFRITSMQPCEVNGMVVKIPSMIWEPTLGSTEKLKISGGKEDFRPVVR